MVDIREKEKNISRRSAEFNLPFNRNVQVLDLMYRRRRADMRSLDDDCPTTVQPSFVDNDGHYQVPVSIVVVITSRGAFAGTADEGEVYIVILSKESPDQIFNQRPVDNLYENIIFREKKRHCINILSHAMASGVIPGRIYFFSGYLIATEWRVVQSCLHGAFNSGGFFRLEYSLYMNESIASQLIPLLVAQLIYVNIHFRKPLFGTPQGAHKYGMKVAKSTIPWSRG